MAHSITRKVPMAQISITVNGKVRKASVQPRMLLVHFLRDHSA